MHLQMRKQKRKNLARNGCPRPLLTPMTGKMHMIPHGRRCAGTANILAVSSGEDKVTLWKESLDGDWVSVNQMDSTTAQ